MKKNNRFRKACLSAEEFFEFVAHPPEDAAQLEQMQNHVAACSHCRQEVAQLLKLLYPENGETYSHELGPPAPELDEAVALVQEVARREGRSPLPRNVWMKRAAVAAVLFVTAATGTLGVRHLQDRRRATQYLVEARAAVEEYYSGSSPNGLRLDLPFRVAGRTRSAQPGDQPVKAEMLFHQSLTLAEDMVEARIGLGSVYMQTGRFARAREEFEKVLQRREENVQALIGRGVASYEEALPEQDPLRRHALLDSALNDFERALRNAPVSAEARYNKIWTLYELGRHREALQDCERYLEEDSTSIWSARIRDLKRQIALAGPDAYKEEVQRAAAQRDAASLRSMVRLVPDAIPAAIRYALRRSLDIENVSGTTETGGPADFRWAASIMESQYQSVTGDKAYARLIRFYDGLSPLQRNRKRELDARFQAAVDLHRKGDIAAALAESVALASAFGQIADFWQLTNIHHLRGNCRFYQADFRQALLEYERMADHAELTTAADLRATALGALLTAHIEQQQIGDAIRTSAQLQSLASTYRLTYWRAFAAGSLGEMYLDLRQPEAAMPELSAALIHAYRSRNEDRLVKAVEDLGNAMEQLNRPGDARTLYAEALALLGDQMGGNTLQPRSQLDARRLNLLCKQGEMALRSADWNGAEDYFREAAAAASGMTELEGRARVGLAQVRFQQRDDAGAGEQIRRALSLAEKGIFPDVEWQAWFLQGKLHERQGRHEDAIRACERSIAVLERIRERVTSAQLRRTFLIGRFNPYEAIVSLHYHGRNDRERALQFADRSKAITLRESLQAWPVEPGASSRAAPEASFISGALLPPGSLALEYFISEDSLFIFLITSKKVESAVVALPRAKLEALVQDLLRSIQEDREAAFSDLSRRLHRYLIAPVQTLLEREKTHNLIILPDGPLHRLPFAVLLDAQGRFLVERYALSYAPSLDLLRHFLAPDRGEAGSNERSLLLVDGASNLEGARQELANILRLYGKNARLTSPQNLSAIGDMAADADIIHFAGHSVAVGGAPALVLRIGQQAHYLEGNAIQSWNLKKNRFVVLAGCDTGTGPPAAGESPWGLAPAFFKAGAPALVLSLLPLEDREISKLFDQFYESLVSRRLSKAGALQRAQLSMLTSHRSHNRLRPASWAPLVLLGDPR